MADIHGIGGTKPNVVNMLYGSHLYGLNTPNSDYDYKGIYLPSVNELLLGNYAKSFNWSSGNDHEKNQAGDIDAEVIALSKFIHMACNGETLSIDMLHSNKPLTSSWIWEDLCSKRTQFYSKDMRAFVGFVRKQAAKYGVKGERLAVVKEALGVAVSYNVSENRLILRDIVDALPKNEQANLVLVRGVSEEHRTQEFYEICGRKFQLTIKITEFIEVLSKILRQYGARAKAAEDNGGVDWKAISHAFRVAYQLRDIFQEGDFKYPLKETDFILQVKTGQLDFDNQVREKLNQVVEEVEELSEKSDFPSKVDRHYWDEWLLDVYYHVYPALGDSGLGGLVPIES